MIEIFFISKTFQTVSLMTDIVLNIDLVIPHNEILYEIIAPLLQLSALKGGFNVMHS